MAHNRKLIGNSLLPLTYTVTYANSPSSQPGYFVSITDTTNYLPLITYVTAVPVVSASFGTQFGLVTNWLGYWPATNTPAGIQAAVGFVIATNGGFVSLGQITAGLGYTPPTNSIAGLNFVYGLPPAAVPATNTDPRIVFAVTNTTALWGTNVMLVRLLTPGLSLTNSYTTNSDNSVTLNIGMAFQAATNVLTRMTSSNPTNSYATGTLYTNGNFKSFLTGYATGGILNYTNNATAYILPLTNDFCVPLTTNTTFSIIGGTVTNVVNWQ